MPDTKYTDWEPAEDATLARLWIAGTPIKKIVDELPGRTYSAIAKRRQKLALPLRSGPAADPAAHPVMQKLWRTLKKRRATRAQLQKRSNAAHSTVTKFIQLYRPQIHICGWAGGPRGAFFEILAAGPGDDAPKPAALTPSEKCHRWWEKCKRDRPLDAELRLARDRVRRRERDGKHVRRDIAAIALFGERGGA